MLALVLYASLDGHGNKTSAGENLLKDEEEKNVHKVLIFKQVLLISWFNKLQEKSFLIHKNRIKYIYISITI